MVRTVRRVLAVFLWLLALTLPVVLIPLVQGVRAHMQAADAQQWPQVPALVRHAQVHSRCHKVCVHRIELEYHYQWQQRELRGGRLWCGEQLAGSAAEAQALVAALAPGQPIRVHVDPRNPARSVVHASVAPRTWERAGAPLLVWLLALGVWQLLRWLLPFVDTR